MEFSPVRKPVEVDHRITTTPMPVLTPITIFGIFAVSILYFADILIRSSQKLYWSDELFTVYLCQMPTFKGTWHAVLNGADFNPPLFYLLTRTSEALFGHGLIATRLPATVGMWLFGLCLFTFVTRRVGAIAGSIAALFPFFTLANYYAYEARPHGLVLGWCGLALLCWQMTTESKTKNYLWSLAFFASLVGAALTHVFAIYLLAPFGCAELFVFLRERRINWSAVLPLIATPVIAVPIYLPMLRVYRLLFHQVGGLQQRPLDVMQAFLSSLLDPAITFAFIVLVFLAFVAIRQRQSHASAPTIPEREFVLAIAFACLPVFGLVGVKITHGVFFDRYFLASTAGWSMLLGFVTSKVLERSSLSKWLLAALLALFMADVGMAVRHLANHSDFALIEPASKMAFSSDVSQPMLRHEALIHPQDGRDILVLKELDYIYLFHYAPPAVASRLYDGALNDDDVMLNAFRLLHTWAGVDLKTSTLDAFLKSHQQFLVYSGSGGPFEAQCGDCVDIIQKAGFHLASEQRDQDGVLYSYESTGSNARPD